MIKLFFHPSPNPFKVALFLEEAEVPYELVVTDTRKGDQHKPEFLKINPNAKTPAILDDDIRVFDSNAILLYLAEKYQKFLPANTPENRAETLSWLMFIATGIGPYSGQAVHFKRYAPEPIEYAINRYDFEAWRHWNILNEHLANHRYMVGNAYSIIDMAVWGWARVIPFVLGDEGSKFDNCPTSSACSMRSTVDLPHREQKPSKRNMSSKRKSMTMPARISFHKMNAWPKTASVGRIH